MANRILAIGDTSAEFGPVGTGSIILQAEVGTYDSNAGTISNTDMASGEQWTVEQADANLPDDQKLWSAVHFTGASGSATAFNGITEDNRILSFFTADGYVYRVRKTAPSADTGTNTNVAFTWDQVNTRIWQG